MRRISPVIIQQAVARLCVKANTRLRPDVLSALRKAYQRESRPGAKDVLAAIIRNAAIAGKEGLAICQDTGLACVFVELGRDLRIAGDIKAAINKGVASGYKKGYLRNSIISDPLSRRKPGYEPAIIHLDLAGGSRLKLTVLPKGFGCENKSRLKMFNPLAGLDRIRNFVIDCVKEAGPDACPPYVVGVGIGGTADYACLLAKKALLRKITGNRPRQAGGVSRLEQDLLKEINRLNIGPMGLGGKTTCLGVNVETFATHIAGLPVAVNISCHALRSATKKL
ncbi:MAG: fumarate hydratase [Candidatus Omnitrophota bacterium]